MSWNGTHPNLSRQFAEEFFLQWRPCRNCLYLWRCPLIHSHFNSEGSCSRCGLPGDLVLWSRNAFDELLKDKEALDLLGGSLEE